MEKKYKIKHALAAASSLALAYLFPMYFGISDTSSAAITVMVIAASDHLGTSLQKGLYRVVGTLIGAVLGLILLSLFPQERMAYLTVLSVLASGLLYIARAYRGDKTIFMLSAITMMMMFDGGAMQERFVYALERVVMTIIGILIYTAVSVYFFTTPSSPKEEEKRLFSFVWGDVEDIKGAIVTFLIFWTGAFFWIYFALPYGYFVMVLATALSLYTAYSIVKPSVLILLFSVSLLVAALSYVFILPHLEGWWSLFVFVFVYAFIGFYFLPQEISIFYLVGLSTFMLQNQMSYSFAAYLFVLLIFYLFLALLLLYDYVPFDQSPQRLFVTSYRRFERMLARKENVHKLEETFEKLKRYAAGIDTEYFGISKKQLDSFLEACAQALKERSVALLPHKRVLDLEKLTETKF